VFSLDIGITETPFVAPYRRSERRPLALVFSRMSQHIKASAAAAWQFLRRTNRAWCAECVEFMGESNRSLEIRPPRKKNLNR
jgi:hypothetical protein